MADIRFENTSTPSTPPSGKTKIFVDTDKHLKQIDDDGNIKDLTAGGAGFYGLVVEESDLTNTFKKERLVFTADDFIIADDGGGDPQVSLETSIARISDLPPAFYGVSTKHSDDSASFSGISFLSFQSEFFYLTQNDPNTDEVQINLRNLPGAQGGEANTATNLGGGEGVFSTKVGVDLRFKSLVAGSEISISSDSDEITISGDGFYGITVGETDEDPSFRGINKVNFNSSTFYVTQNSGNTDEVVVNFREALRPSVTKDITIQAPAANEDISFFMPIEDVAIKEVYGVLRGSDTPSVGFYIKFDPDRSAIGTSLLGQDERTLNSTTTVQSFQVSGGGSVSSNNFVWIETVGVSGTVDEMHLTLKVERE